MKRLRLDPNSDESDIFMSPEERYLIFEQTYPEKNDVKVDHELFQKNYAKLKSEGTIFRVYAEKLSLTEESIKIEKARLKFKTEYGLFVSDECMKLFFVDMKFDIIPLMNKDSLSYEMKLKITKIINQHFENKTFADQIVKNLLHNESDTRKLHILCDIKNEPYAPSKVTGELQIQGQENNQNFIYPYPFHVVCHFPIFACHPIFNDFMNIVLQRKDDDYRKFIDELGDKESEAIDKGIRGLIKVILLRTNYSEVSECEDNEHELDLDFVEIVVEELKSIFPKVESQILVNEESNSNIKIDAAVMIENFPFLLMEAKKKELGLDTALQAFQYYGLVRSKFIDNDPCFVATFTSGLLNIYGVASMNNRVVCDCLFSLEFSNYHSNINGFLKKLYRCFTGLLYLHNNLLKRIKAIAEKEKEKESENESEKESETENETENDYDYQHQQYYNHKIQKTCDDQPWPAIFSVKRFESNETVSISFMNVKTETEVKSNFKPNVYLVKTEDGKLAVLKISYNYSIEAHKAIASIGLAPSIIGYEKMWNDYHVILMEYLDEYKTLDKVLITDDENGEMIVESVRLLLSKVHDKNIVHGDFRSRNIMAKVTQTRCAVKLIDFEFSGPVWDENEDERVEGQPNKRYPCLVLKNSGIKWPKGFNSFKPRRFSHDLFMFNRLF